MILKAGGGIGILQGKCGVEGYYEKIINRYQVIMEK